MKYRWLAPIVAIACFASLVPVVAHAIASDPFQELPLAIMLAILTVVGLLLAWKRPRLSLGWMVLAVPALFGLRVPAALLGAALVSDAPGLAAWLLWYNVPGDDEWSWIPPIWLLLSQIPLRFPDGHLPSRRWRGFSWFTVFALVVGTSFSSTWAKTVAPGLANPVHIPWDPQTRSVLTLILFGALMVPSLVGSIASLFARYRGGGSVARAQLRWVFWAVFVSVGLLVGSWAIPSGPFVAAQGLVLLGYTLIPIAIAIAVLRYRLYEIDRIISRTASYAIVTLILVGSYALVVVSVSAILPNLPSVPVALATLAAAALFWPVLRLVQRVVDRRFDRARYDAQKVVEAFGERLRNGSDPNTAAVELGDAVEATLQPSAMGLWVARPSSVVSQQMTAMTR